MKMTSDPPLRLGLRTLMALGKIYARGFHQLDVRTTCSLPSSGPAILVCNHISGIDPVMIQSACRRHIVWMMAREYYELPALRWGFELVEAIPVARSGNDLAATRAALRVLHNGRILGVFPEGRIETTAELLPFQSGTAMLAHRAGVNVYPAFLDGTPRGKTMSRAFVQPQSVSLTFGRELALQFVGKKPDLDAPTAKIRRSVEQLRDVASSLQYRPHWQA